MAEEKTGNDEERKWTDSDLEAALKRAFTGKNGNDPADFIVYDGHAARNQFLCDGINLIKNLKPSVAEAKLGSI